MCYTDKDMQRDSHPEMRSSWPAWADFLRQHGLEDMAAWTLEAAGPLTVIGAQLVYFGSPLLRPALTDTQCNELASLLEDRAEAQAFAAFLREEGSP
jgi:hypothetical protein